MCVSQTAKTFSSTVGTHVLSGDLQLLIPAWKLNTNGFISQWQAIVQGQVSSSAIEFQIFRPSSKTDDAYDLVYGNTINPYKEQTGNLVSLDVSRFTESL